MTTFCLATPTVHELGTEAATCSTVARRLDAVMQEWPDRPLSIFLGEHPRLMAEVRLHEAMTKALLQNWDGMGGSPIQPGSVVYARRLLRVLPSWAPMPNDISVEHDGEIGLDWQLGPQRTVAISVGRDGTLGFAGLIGDERAFGTATYRGAVPPAIAALLGRLIA